MSYVVIDPPKVSPTSHRFWTNPKADSYEKWGTGLPFPSWQATPLSSLYKIMCTRTCFKIQTVLMKTTSE